MIDGEEIKVLEFNARLVVEKICSHLNPPQRGDIIVEFDGQLVENDDHLVAQVGLTEVGSQIPMIIYRNGKRYRTEVVLTDLD